MSGPTSAEFADYAVVQFNSTFKNKAKAVETVVMTAEDGKWQVAGYFIR